jgi:hypothetical protein
MKYKIKSFIVGVKEGRRGGSPTGFDQPASGPLAKPRQQPKGVGANIAVWRVGRWPGAMTVIEIRPHRWGWKAFESPGAKPVFPKKDHALEYAQGRACFRSGEIHVLDSTGKLERIIAFSEADRKL